MHELKLHPWSHPAREGFTLRGWHSVPSGKPLLHVLHGNGFCARMYEPMLKPLSAHFDLWLSDVQGHGDSDEGALAVHSPIDGSLLVRLAPQDAAATDAAIACSVAATGAAVLRVATASISACAIGLLVKA